MQFVKGVHLICYSALQCTVQCHAVSHNLVLPSTVSPHPPPLITRIHVKPNPLHLSVDNETTHIEHGLLVLNGLCCKQQVVAHKYILCKVVLSTLINFSRQQYS